MPTDLAFVAAELEGVSLAAQEQQIAGYAMMKGWTVGGSVETAVAGASRPHRLLQTMHVKSLPAHAKVRSHEQ
jgi:hypothetical protein